ncbi:hypothetical protein TRFO_42996 [Tritrichomonas foetus]|uniref:Protein kinase domain-containing protein n=1 Tax=Tritrichomonas foetus TaxID=1144522 RepID=A0A1J4KUI1_9EUKA|nr:hypothetical protein TRFO_42996 [Tritrichomonas foetus]|eukprot:OHT14552.1 hypothetical protein TRFO_42996 [Tritrichomonas foetus]
MTKDKENLYFASPKTIGKVLIPPTVKHIHDCCFQGCKKINEVEMSPNLNIIGISSFFECSKLSEIHFPSKLKFIYSSAFSKCTNLKLITFPDDSQLERIDDFAFQNTSLEKVKFPPTLKEIRKNAFSRCLKLKTVEFLKLSDVTIDETAFSKCNPELDIVDFSSREKIVEREHKIVEPERITIESIQETVEFQNLLKERDFYQNKADELQKKVDVLKRNLADMNKFNTALAKPIPSIYDFAIDFKDFKFKQDLGSGHFGQVKLYSKPQYYAIKSISNFDEQNMKRFMCEVESQIRLKHPCVVRVFGFNTGNPKKKVKAQIAMEYIPNGTLESHLIANDLDNQTKSLIILDICLGMRFIHRRGFVHRDLKPQNIMLTDEFDAKITDFGCSRFFDINDELAQTNNIGTLKYMAPEIKDENPYNNKVDVYSFGVT